jgi:hypothetical protein
MIHVRADASFFYHIIGVKEASDRIDLTGAHQLISLRYACNGNAMTGKPWEAMTEWNEAH